MSYKGKKVKEALRDFLKSGIKVFPVTVKEVHDDTCAIDVVTAEGMEIFNVKLKALITEKYGHVIYPVIDTTVLISQIGEDNDFVVLHCDQVSYIYWKVGDMTMELTEEGFTFNEGVNKGMVKLPELVQKLNTIENKVNELITWSSTHTHTGVMTGGGSSGPAVGIVGSITPTQESDIENDKIKQ